MKKFYERYWDNQEVLDDFRYKWPVVKKYIPTKKNIRLLDFGCGKGVILQKILKINPALKITGVDVSDQALKVTRKKLPNQKFIKIDEGVILPFDDNTFDFITVLDVLEHVYDTQLIYKELARILKPRGKILITVPFYGLIKNLIIATFAFEFVYNPQSPHIRFYTKKSLSRELKQVYLKPLRFEYFGRFYPISHGMLCLATK